MSVLTVFRYFSLHPADAVHKGFGTIPTNILQRKNGICIYRSRKPLIVTTNLTLDEIRHPQDTAHARIYDRLLEMCVPVFCIGVSFRKENAQEKLERLKELIG